jgi:alpha-D-xyloside xylohydrolase
MPALTLVRRVETAALAGSMPDGMRLMSDAGPIDVQAYAPGVVRLRMGTQDRPDYGLLVGAAHGVAARVTGDAAGAWRLQAGDVAVEFASAPVRIRLAVDGRTLLESATDGHIRGGLRLPAFGWWPAEDGGGLPAAGWVVSLGLRYDEAIYGHGEKFGPLNHRGQLLTSWNEDAWGVNAEAAYKNVPFAWSPAGWGVFVHTTARVWHGVGYPRWSHRSYVLGVDDPALDLFFIAARSPAELLERYTALTGRAPAPPRWSFGAWMSRCYYATAEEALEVARTLRRRRIPCDVLVLDGRAWLAVETRCGFEWDPSRYPDPAAFIRELKGLGFRLCLWEYPYVSIHNPLFAELAAKGCLLRDRAGQPYVYRWSAEPFGSLLTPLPPSGLVDFTNPAAWAWYAGAHRPLFAAGVDAMKTDFGEQVPEDAVAHNGDDGRRLHNVYPLLYNRCVYEAAERYASGGAMVWGRSGWAGSQRYPVQWGGDPQTDWEGLAASIRGGLSWGLSGAPFHSTDIGGFYGPPPAPELYIRWLQAGVMASHTRFHGMGPREPWAYGEQAERIAREWLTWRYRLIPYLEACAGEAHRTGLPVMRAMPLAFPDDRAAWAFEHQYMLGPALLVAPVLQPGGRVRAYLPEGAWFDLWSGEATRGPRVVEQTMPLDRIPVYGREGQSLPLGPVVQHTGELAGRAPVEELWTFGRTTPPAAPAGVRLRVWGR